MDGHEESPAVTLTDFLLARIAEDEAVARDDQCQDPWIELGPADGVYFVGSDDRGGTYLATSPARVLAECEAKRLVISTLQAWDPDPVAPERVETAEHDAWRMLACLALPYADHPDYREEWRP